MKAATLAKALLDLPPAATEAKAVQDFADAYATFAAEATAVGSPILAPGVAAGKAAMLLILPGMSAPGVGAAKLLAGIQAFWGGVAVAPPVSFTSAIAVVPPPHAGLLALLVATFLDNIARKLSKADATAAIAANMYAEALGGTVTMPVANVFSIL